MLMELVLQREQEVAKVRHFAYHDELTGLPNRTLLLDRLNQALVRAKRQRKQLALLLRDLRPQRAGEKSAAEAAPKLLQANDLPARLRCVR